MQWPYKKNQYSKCIKTGAVFTKIKMNNEWKFSFFKIVPLPFSTFIPASFSLVNAPLKLPFSFNAIHIFKSYSSYESLVQETWKSWTELSEVNTEDSALT